MGLSIRIVKKVEGFTLDVEWQIGKELAVLFGSSGSGKSMTLQCIAGIMEPDEGWIQANGDFFFNHTSKINVPPQRRSFGYVFQDRVLFPHMTVEENINFGLKGMKRYERQEKLKEMVRLFNIEGLEDKFPSEISGGQKQRVALARTLVRRPKALLLDEPFTALDYSLRMQMRRLLKDITNEFDIPVVLITHDILEAYTMADKVIVYSKGRVSGVGSPTEIFRRPEGLEIEPILSLFYSSNFQ